MNQQDTKTLERLTSAANIAKAAYEANPCLKTRDAYRTAWNAIGEWMAATGNLPKSNGATSRAGQRQAAERYAITMARLARKRW